MILQELPSSSTMTATSYLSMSYPYLIQAQAGNMADPPAPWPPRFRPPPAIEQAVRRLRFSLMLAVEREYRVLLVQTWRAFDEPFSFGIAHSWSDPRHGTTLMPTQLTPAEVGAWGEWYDRLNAPEVDKIDLALSRILRAVAERREPSDVLVDSVIAWENLFGTKEGEPNLPGDRLSSKTTCARHGGAVGNAHEVGKNLCAQKQSCSRKRDAQGRGIATLL